MPMRVAEAPCALNVAFRFQKLCPHISRIPRYQAIFLHPHCLQWEQAYACVSVESYDIVGFTWLLR